MRAVSSRSGSATSWPASVLIAAPALFAGVLLARAPLVVVALASCALPLAVLLLGRRAHITELPPECEADAPPRVRLDECARRLAATRDRACVFELRRELWNLCGIPAGETIGGTASTGMGAELLAVELAAFAPESKFQHSLDRALELFVRHA